MHCPRRKIIPPCSPAALTNGSTYGYGSDGRGTLRGIETPRRAGNVDGDGSHGRGSRSGHPRVLREAGAHQSSEHGTRELSHTGQHGSTPHPFDPERYGRDPVGQNADPGSNESPLPKMSSAGSLTHLRALHPPTVQFRHYTYVMNGTATTSPQSNNGPDTRRKMTDRAYAPSNALSCFKRRMCFYRKEPGEELRPMSRLAPLTLIFAVVVATGCAPARTNGDGDARSGALTYEELRSYEASYSTLYEVIDAYRAEWLDPRGQISVRANPRAHLPVVFVEGSERGQAPVLRNIAVTDVERVEFLDPGEATTRYGAGYPGGVIEVKLRGG